MVNFSVTELLFAIIALLWTLQLHLPFGSPYISFLHVLQNWQNIHAGLNWLEIGSDWLEIWSCEQGVCFQKLLMQLRGQLQAKTKFWRSMKSTTERVGAAKPLGATPAFSDVLLTCVFSFGGSFLNWICGAVGWPPAILALHSNLDQSMRNRQTEAVFYPQDHMWWQHQILICQT